jgi:hypothetical protein
MPARIDWTPELERNVLEGIESGSTLREVARANNISCALILKKVAANKDFCDQYARVLELRTESDFEKLADLVFEEPERGKFGIDSAWVNLKRLQVDTLKWALSKRNPKKYGDKITHAGDADNPVVVKRVVADI